MRKRLVILGSTGSIGRQTLDIVAAHPERLEVVGLAAGRDAAGLGRQAAEFGVRHVALGSAEAAAAWPDDGLQVYPGPEGLCALVRELKPDLVVAALSGGVGLASLLAALETGAAVALANKEPLVTAGHLVTATARKHGAELRPVDSEISAVWQCLHGWQRGEVERLLLTASGGPFAGWEAAALATVTPQQALAHPTWRMGPKVTVDSATLMNKGFELFELKWLFGVEMSRIKVLVHHQSLLHSAVQFRDGSCLGQLGLPDMRTPIQLALSWPERWENDLPRLDLAAQGSLTFGAPEVTRFPCLRLAREAGEAGQSYPAVLSAADEVAVQAFLAGTLDFPGIPRVIGRALEAHTPFAVETLAEVQRAEAEGRELVRGLIGRKITGV